MGLESRRFDVSWWVEGKLLGQNYYDWVYPGNTEPAIGPEAFFCRHCGEIWGRIYVSNAFRNWWFLTERCCKKHGQGWLYLPNHPKLWASAPPPVHIRELLLMPEGLEFDYEGDPARWWTNLNNHQARF